MASDGMTYAPKGRHDPVVEPGEFRVAVVMLEHGHIYGMCEGLKNAGATIAYVFDPDPKKIAAFRNSFPEAQALADVNEALQADDVQLVAASAVPAERGALGVQVMRAGKDYFTDKAPFTAFSQLEEAKRVVAETGRKYFVYYSERLHSESGIRAGELIRDGAIGEVVQVTGFGPHRLNAPARPAWFFERERHGGILCDLGSHQIEQFLYYAGAEDARVEYAYAGNHGHPEFPEMEDFGEAILVADNGARNYFRVDWFTPDALPVWGDGRTLILGTEGYIEMRKYLDLTRDERPDHLFLVSGDRYEHMELAGKVGYPFFGQLILDSLERTESAMTQAHAFKAAELYLTAQAMASARSM